MELGMWIGINDMHIFDGARSIEIAELHKNLAASWNLRQYTWNAFEYIGSKNIVES